MSFEYIKEIPGPQDILAAMPLDRELSDIKKNRDVGIKAVFTKESRKFLLLIGPCSAHDENAVCDYIGRLAKVQEEVKDRIIVTILRQSRRLYVCWPLKGAFSQTIRTKKQRLHACTEISNLSPFRVDLIILFPFPELSNSVSPPAEPGVYPKGIRMYYNPGILK